MEQRQHRGTSAAALLAIIVLIAAGVANRVLTGSVSDVRGSVVLPPGTLRALDLDIGAWHGAELTLDDRLVAATDTEDHIYRQYQLAGTRDLVHLFVAYGVRFRELLPHRPEVCYPGSGWTLEHTAAVELPVEATGIPAQMFRFARGGLTHDRISVLSYYLVDGQPCADESSLRELVGARDATARYVAQVQVTGRHPLRPQLADDMIVRFAAESAPLIQQLLSQAVERQIEGPGS